MAPVSIDFSFVACLMDSATVALVSGGLVEISVVVEVSVLVR